MGLNLLQRVEDDTDHNQQGCAAEEVGELLVDTKHVADDGGQDGDDSEEEGTRKGDLRHDVINVLGGLFARFHTGDETAVLLQLLRNLLRVDGDSRIEIGEEDNHDEEHDVVSPTVVVDEAIPETAGGDFGHIDEGEGQEHDGLREDDRHNAGRVHLEGEEVAGAAILLVADDSLSILNRNAARTLHEQDGEADDEHQHNQFDDEDDGAAVHFGDAGDRLEIEGVRETGDDTDHNDHGDTVADTLIGNLFTEPHQEEGGADQQDVGTHGECRNAKDFGVQHIGGKRLDTVLAFEVGDVGGSLDGHNRNGQITGDLVDLLTAAFALLLQTLEVGDNQSEQLDDDGGGDVRHDTQREDGGVGERAAREEVQKTEQTAAGLFGELCQGTGVHARKHDVRTEAVDQDDGQRVEDSLAEVFNLENVLYGFDKSFHLWI